MANEPKTEMRLWRFEKRPFVRLSDHNFCSMSIARRKGTIRFLRLKVFSSDKKPLDVAVVQLVERSLLTPEIPSSNPLIGKIYFLSSVLKTQKYRKRGWDFLDYFLASIFSCGVDVINKF